MKKKILFISVIMVLCLSSVVNAASTFTDLKNSKYKDAVEKLVSFNIVNGFEDNTFKPENSVTRAQLSKMLVISMGMEDEVDAASKKFLSFNDVLSSYWGYGYIKVASDNKIVNGYTNGSFKPEGTVTYAEATAMVIRALGYDDEIKKSTLEWPNNYMSYADSELDLFDGISEFKADNPANRGDIALLIWNALRTGICDIVGENSNGLIYGEGTPMITEYLGYVYIEDAIIDDIDFDSDFKKADVTFKDDKKEKYEFELDIDDLLDIYGRKVTLLLDKKTNKILSLATDDELIKVEGEVTRIAETKIYLANRKTGYKRPKDENVLLLGIDSIEDAVEVVLLLDGSTPEYCICRGATDVEVGIVVDSNAKVEDYDEKGVKIRNVGATKGGKSYLLADDEIELSKGDAILYYINADDMLVVLRQVEEDDAKDIANLTKKSIKIKKTTYTFEDEDEYSVIFVGSSKLTENDLDDIDDVFDAACVEVYNGHTYIFVFADAGGSDIDEDVKDAYKELKITIEDALDEYDEAEYTQSSYTKFMKAIYAAEKMDYEDTAEDLLNAVEKIENAIENLEEVEDKTEKKTVKAKKSLRALVVEAEEIIDDDNDYTKKSYEIFYEAYEVASDLITSAKAKLSVINDAYDELEEAIEDLELDE